MASVTPQAISVWCRQMGHEPHYAIYYGIGDIQKLLPNDLDLIFISSLTCYSPLAYALSKIFRKAGVTTVIGGPHAKAFPADCLRFFDIVVKECDKNLIAEIVSGRVEPGSYVSSAAPFQTLPSVEERLPEIQRSALFFKKKQGLLTVIPTMTSMGCPYTCDFCIDWNNPYRLMDLETLRADLAFVSKKLPGALLGFWEPNFAVKFEQVFEVLESLEPAARVPYVMECSMSILNPSRIKRLKETKCQFFTCGVESWTDYSNKAGLGRKSNEHEKFKRTVADFELLRENDRHLQANFIFGLDCDSGELPIEFTKAFIEQAPYVWPTLNTPIPYGGTPLHEQFHKEKRILEAMPLCFYYTPYLVITLKNYDPLSYYEHLTALSSFNVSKSMMKMRMHDSANWKHKLLYKLRTAGEGRVLQTYQKFANLMRSDRQFREFHEGVPSELPGFYHHEFEKHLGPYSTLISKEDRQPLIGSLSPLVV